MQRLLAAVCAACGLAAQCLAEDVCAAGQECEEETSLLDIHRASSRALAQGQWDPWNPLKCQEAWQPCDLTRWCCLNTVCVVQPPFTTGWRPRPGMCKPWFPPKKDYVVMAEFGSSGSRVFVYSVQRGTLDLKQVGKSTFDKLSSFVNNRTGAQAELKKHIKIAVAQVRALKWAKRLLSKTPIYAFATAGMRTLPSEAAVPLWRAVRQVLGKVGLSYDRSNAKTISGDLEGVYQWVTVNRLLKAERTEDYRGILEMGGASLQATFQPTTDLEMIMNHEFDMYYLTPSRSLQDVSLFSDSWLGFGANAANSRFHTLLYENETKNETVNLTRGENRTFLSPCLNSGVVANITLYKSDVKVQFNGTGQSEDCSKQIAWNLIHPNWECIQEPCGVMGRYFPKPGKKRFVAVGNFWWTVKNLRLLNETNKVPLRQISSELNKFCALTREDAERRGFKWDPKFGYQTCVVGHVHYQVLRALGFADDDTTIEYMKEINGVEPSWPAGAVLYETETKVMGGVFRA